jgi:Zn-dependent peptidase ImmA (M78 family)
MKSRDDLARSGAKRALQVRAREGISTCDPLDVYEVIGRMRIDLQFCDIPSLEGMYLDERESRRICVSSHRPWGRQRFTAAHELGHHLFGHGTRVDEVVDRGLADAEVPDEEVVADAFAGVLLMPPRVVQAAFRLRGADPSDPTPQEAYSAACWIGVGYSTLLQQMRWTLGLLSQPAHKKLMQATPKQLKAELQDSPAESDVWPLDDHWEGKTLHAQVGDVILGVRSDAAGAASVIQDGLAGKGVRAAQPGEIDVPLAGGGMVKLRVSRARYVGFYEYRYLEE